MEANISKCKFHDFKAYLSSFQKMLNKFLCVFPIYHEFIPKKPQIRPSDPVESQKVTNGSK